MSSKDTFTNLPSLTIGWDRQDYVKSNLSITQLSNDINTKIHVSDIMIGNQSLKESLDKISNRLAILNIRPDLESDWHELKELGDQYRKLESQILETIKVWDILSKSHENLDIK